MKIKIIPIIILVALFCSCSTTPKTVNTSGRAEQQVNTITQHTNRLWQYKKARFNLYSISDEKKLGKAVHKKMLKAYDKKGYAVNPSEYRALKKRLNQIVKRLAKVSDLPNLPYEITLIKRDDVANAYCLPGGKMGIYTGIFTQVNPKGFINMNSDDEIATVLAHEMAHANMRHVTRRMTTYNTLGFVSSVLNVGVSNTAGRGWSYLAGQIFSVSTVLYMPGYSRKHEREADQVGFYYMAKAGYNPQAAIDLWERASGMKKEKDKTHFFSSHPASHERAANLRGYLPDALSVQQQEKQQNEIYRKMRE